MTTIQRKIRFRNLFGSESTDGSDLVNSKLEYPKLVLYHHHANWVFLDRRVQALYIRSLQLRMISSTVEHMGRVERAPSTRDGATKCFSPTRLRGGPLESVSQTKEEQPVSSYPHLRPGACTQHSAAALLPRSSVIGHILFSSGYNLQSSHVAVLGG